MMAEEKTETENKNSGTYYAWSKFKKEQNEWGQVTKWINVGDQISQSDIDASDEDWQELIDVGAVREEEYPDVPNDTPPVDAPVKDEEEENAVKELQMRPPSQTEPSQTQAQAQSPTLKAPEPPKPPE